MIDDRVGSYKDIAKKVGLDEAISTISMSTLRNVHGKVRLGVEVVKQISESLEEVGLLHQPAELPTDQNAIVLLFEKKSTLGKLMTLLDNIRADTDEKIYNIVNADDAQVTLEKIRRLVGPVSA